MLFRFLYRLSLSVYGLVVRFASPFSSRARKFREGRKGIFGKLANELHERQGTLVWIHAASLGEFEQGRPVMESLKNWKPDIKILVTFFSPSGYEVRKNHSSADYVFYLPMDSPSNASRFVAVVKPDLAVFIKYELWYYYLLNLQRSGIPVLVISAVFRSDQLYFKTYGAFFKLVLRKICHFYVQNSVSQDLLRSLGIDQVTVAGDTRVDRVIANMNSHTQVPLLEAFQANEVTWILGSIWPSDMRILRPFILHNLDKLKFVLAPHNVNREEINSYLKLPASVTYSKADLSKVADSRILILDHIGTLSSAYKYGDYAYVGGGVRGALHNTLEAAVYGIPVFFGRHVNNFRFLEADGLVKSGAGFEVNDFEEFTTTFERLQSDKALYQRACDSSKNYVKLHAGATRQIISGVKRILEFK